jgi:hypothetical protein
MDFGHLQYHQRFDELCKQLLFIIYPKLKTVDGRGGDEGTDSFVGSITNQKYIFQFKYFPRNLTSTHWKKICKSLYDISHKKPRKWVLLVSSDFTRTDWKKWEDLEQKYLEIKLEVLNGPKLESIILENQGVLASEFTELFSTDIGLEKLRKRELNYKLLSENIYKKLAHYQLCWIEDHPDDMMRLHYDLCLIKSPYYVEGASG